MHNVSAIVPPKQILHSVAEYMKNTRNALRGELVRNKNIVKPHFIGEAEWKKILEKVVNKKRRKCGTLVGKDKNAHTVQASRLATRHRLGKGGMLSAEAKFVSLLHYYVSQVNFIFLIIVFSNNFIIVLNCSCKYSILKYVKMIKNLLHAMVYLLSYIKRLKKDFILLLVMG